MGPGTARQCVSLYRWPVITVPQSITSHRSMTGKRRRDHEPIILQLLPLPRLRHIQRQLFVAVGQ